MLCRTAWFSFGFCPETARDVGVFSAVHRRIREVALGAQTLPERRVAEKYYAG